MTVPLLKILVIGTGGYAAGPVVWRAASRGIPTAIQEQNAYPGLATRLLARRVREIWLGVPEDEGLPAVYVTGGSQGARAINEAVAGWLERGEGEDWGRGKDLQVIWAAGKATFAKFQRFHHPPEVQVFDFLEAFDQRILMQRMVTILQGARSIVLDEIHAQRQMLDADQLDHVVHVLEHVLDSDFALADALGQSQDAA